MCYPAVMSISLDIKTKVMQCQLTLMFDIKKQCIFCVVLKVVQLCNTDKDLYLLIDMTFWWGFFEGLFLLFCSVYLFF